MIKPTVGRVVHYYGPGEADSTPQVALVAHVWSDTCVNLAIFNRNGNSVQNPPTSVLLVQEGAERPTGGQFCEWPPRDFALSVRSIEDSVNGDLSAQMGLGTGTLKSIPSMEPVSTTTWSALETFGTTATVEEVAAPDNVPSQETLSGL